MQISYIKEGAFLHRNYANLHFLHCHCHNAKTASDGSLRRTDDKGQIIEEPNEAKLKVLKEVS